MKPLTYDKIETVSYFKAHHIPTHHEPNEITVKLRGR